VPSWPSRVPGSSSGGVCGPLACSGRGRPLSVANLLVPDTAFRPRRPGPRFLAAACPDRSVRATALSSPRSLRSGGRAGISPHSVLSAAARGGADSAAAAGLVFPQRRTGAVRAAAGGWRRRGLRPPCTPPAPGPVERGRARPGPILPLHSHTVPSVAPSATSGPSRAERHGVRVSGRAVDRCAQRNRRARSARFHSRPARRAAHREGLPSGPETRPEIRVARLAPSVCRSPYTRFADVPQPWGRSRWLRRSRLAVRLNSHRDAIVPGIVHGAQQPGAGRVSGRP